MKEKKKMILFMWTKNYTDVSAFFYPITVAAAVAVVAVVASPQIVQGLY